MMGGGGVSGELFALKEIYLHLSKKVQILAILKGIRHKTSSKPSGIVGKSSEVLLV